MRQRRRRAQGECEGGQRAEGTAERIQVVDRERVIGNLRGRCGRITAAGTRVRPADSSRVEAASCYTPGELYAQGHPAAERRGGGCSPAAAHQAACVQVARTFGRHRALAVWEAWHHARDRVHGAAQPTPVRVSSIVSAVSRGESAPVSRHAGLALALVVAAAFVVRRWSIRAAQPDRRRHAARASAICRRSNCSREHREFNPLPIANLRYGKPAWVFIGDSMLGTRIDPFTSARFPPPATRSSRSCSTRRPDRRGGIWPSRTTWCASGVQAARRVRVLPRHQPHRHAVPPREPVRQRPRRGRAPSRSRNSTRSSRPRRRGVWSRVHTAAVRRLRDRRRHRLDGAGDAPLVRQLALPRHQRRGARFDRLLNERFDLANLRRRRRRRFVGRQRGGRLRPRPADLGAAADDRPGAASTASRCASCACSAGPTGSVPPRAVRRTCALRRRPAHLARGQRRAVPRRLGRPRACPSRSTPTATTCATAGTTPRCSVAGWTRCSDDLPQPRLRRLLPDRRDDLLAAVAPGAERAAAGGELRLLRLGASVVRADHAGLDHGRLLGRPAHGGRPGAQAPLSRARAWR